MVIHIELRPEEEKALLERARLAGRDPSQYVRELIRDSIPGVAAGDDFDELVDQEFVEYCRREADDSVTLEEVRAVTSKITDSMARVVIEEERAERF